MGFEVASGAKVLNKLTVLDATLDGHSFRIPVAFADGVTFNLIGHVGFSDQWDTRSDPTTLSTLFTCTGVANGFSPWVDMFETYWNGMLGLGYDWVNWNANGRPTIPQTPQLPSALPKAP